LNTHFFHISPLPIRSAVTVAMLCAAHAGAEPVTPARGHANGEHPAVLVKRLAVAPGIDSNTFIVQPPASVSWTTGPTLEPSVRLAGAPAAADRALASR